jgi:hypothetical protein
MRETTERHTKVAGKSGMKIKEGLRARLSNATLYINSTQIF